MLPALRVVEREEPTIAELPGKALVQELIVESGRDSRARPIENVIAVARWRHRRRRREPAGRGVAAA